MTSLVLAEQRGRLGILTLNRGAVLNALNLEMLDSLMQWLTNWQDDNSIEVVVLRSNDGRAFCSGGDIRAVHARSGDDAFMDRIYRIEYALDLMIHHYPKPFLALINGITMGGGCGISMHAAYRISSPDLVLAMPETGIGFFPDAGGTYFLSRLPDGVGLFMGMTGFRLAAGDALDLGLIDAVVERDQHERLLDQLVEGAHPSELVARAEVSPDIVRVLDQREPIRQHFHGQSAIAIRDRLASDDSVWARETLRHLETRAPFSLEITARAIGRAQDLSLQEALLTEFRLAQRFMQGNDYFEGVRSVLIDRDNAPHWEPDRLDGVDADIVESWFKPLESPSC